MVLVGRLALVFQGKVTFALLVCAEAVSRKSSLPWRVWTHLIWIRLTTHHTHTHTHTHTPRPPQLLLVIAFERCPHTHTHTHTHTHPVPPSYC